MILEIGLGLSITTAVLSLYVNWNLMRKTELLETWVEDFGDRVTRVQQELKDIDSTGHFESDDEIGAIFEGIKEVINELNDLTEGEEISGQD